MKVEAYRIDAFRSSDELHANPETAGFCFPEAGVYVGINGRTPNKIAITHLMGQHKDIIAGKVPNATAIPLETVPRDLERVVEAHLMYKADLSEQAYEKSVAAKNIVANNLGAYSGRYLFESVQEIRAKTNSLA